MQAEGGEPQATRAVLLSEQALSSPGGTLKKDAAAVEIPADAEPVPVEDEPDAEKEARLGLHVSEEHDVSCLHSPRKRSPIWLTARCTFPRRLHIYAGDARGCTEPASHTQQGSLTTAKAQAEVCLRLALRRDEARRL